MKFNSIKILFCLCPTIIVGGATACSSEMDYYDERPLSKIEFYNYLDNLETFPVNFVYGGKYYSGLDDFNLVRKKQEVINDKEHNVLTFLFDKDIMVTLDANYYNGNDAFDYTLTFENLGQDNTEVFEQVNSMDYKIEGNNPVLKGILGDHENQYKDYATDLTKEDVNFRSDLGRATHIYFPYFNLENDNGGALIALGWAGTWEADFTYDTSSNITRYRANGVIDFKSYLKPGEKFRTPLNAVVRYYERDYGKAMNKWRKWFIDYNLPKENAKGDTFKPKQCVLLNMDTGRPNSDGSISEAYDSWKPSLEKIYSENIQADVRWFDAGWYEAPDGSSPTSDWSGTVGTWKLDKQKWPEDTFKQSVDYAKEHGTQTMVWFEQERMTHPVDMVKNQDYKIDWVLSDYGNNNYFLNNIGKEDCYNWTKYRILSMLSENNVDIYREDFNMDPQILFTVGDGYEGEGRTGISEMKFYMNHYLMWDEIIAYTSSKGGAAYVDACASGGGRNDLESMRRGVPFIRSDSDRTSISLRLAMTTRLNQWIPINGCWAKESDNQLTVGTFDSYVLRASYVPIMTYDYAWTHDEKLDYELLRYHQNEWRQIVDYFYKDFYVLTPMREVNDEENWTVYEYFDSEKNSGVLQAFRPKNSEESQITIKLKGVKEDSFYSINDFDDNMDIPRISGRMLKNGLTLRLPQRGSLVLEIQEVE